MFDKTEKRNRIFILEEIKVNFNQRLMFSTLGRKNFVYNIRKYNFTFRIRITSEASNIRIFGKSFYHFQLICNFVNSLP